DRTHLVVRPDDGEQGDVVMGPQGLGERVETDAADLVDRDPVDGGALVALEPLDGVNGGVVLAVGDEDAGSRQARLVSTSSTRFSALVSTSSTRFGVLVSTRS